jgi:hypothetical protein
MKQCGTQSRVDCVEQIYRTARLIALKRHPSLKGLNHKERRHLLTATLGAAGVHEDGAPAADSPMRVEMTLDVDKPARRDTEGAA